MMVNILIKDWLLEQLDAQDSHWLENVFDGLSGFTLTHEDGRTVNLFPFKYGKWVYNPNGMDWNLGYWQCGECHCNNDNLGADEKINPINWAGSKFCPNCGARMIGYERSKKYYE